MFSRDKVAAERRGEKLKNAPLRRLELTHFPLQGPRSDLQARPDKCARFQRRSVWGRDEIRAFCDKFTKWVFRFFPMFWASRFDDASAFFPPE